MASEGLRRMDREVRERQSRMGEHKDALSALKASTAKSKALKNKIHHVPGGTGRMHPLQIKLMKLDKQQGRPE